MRRLIGWPAARAFAVIFLMISCGACQNENVAGTTSDITSVPPTTSNGGISCGTDQFCVNVTPPTNTTMVLHQDGSYTEPCDVTLGSDTACILDADELDLYDQGFGLTYNVPPGMCTYFRMQPYFYYQYQPGVGPTQVTISVDPTTGAITESDSNDGIPTSGEASASPTTMTHVGIQLPYTTTPLCSANYTNVGGPNCCYGNYTLTLIEGDPATVTTTEASWGGNPNNCLVGPGVDSQTLYSGLAGNLEDGYPQATLVALDGSYVSGTYTVKAPIAKGFSSNAYISNFWQSQVTGEYPLTTDGSAVAAPNAMQGPLVTASTYVPGCIPGQPFCTGNPWYEFDCLDGADDYVARIRVMVRSWTSNTNFAEFVADQSVLTGTTGNSLYNLWGAEPSPFGDQPLADFETWVTPDDAFDSIGSNNGTTGAVNASCYNQNTPDENCGFGSMYPGAGN